MSRLTEPTFSFPSRWRPTKPGGSIDDRPPAGAAARLLAAYTLAKKAGN
jgi:hypothetical protein